MKKILLSAIFLIALSINAQPVSMGIIGEAVGGWNDANEKAMTSTDNINYTINNLTMFNGQCKFRTFGTWSSIIIGATANPNFPGPITGVNGNDPNSEINAVAGRYNVTLNRNTRVYTFTALEVFNVINISGTAVGANPISLSANSDGINYFARGVNLSTGNLLINQTAPTATTWSGTTFPSGTASTGTAGIPVTAGRYNILFNRTTGAYGFNPVIFTIIGNGVGGFNDSNEIPLTTTNGINYSLASVTIAVTNGNSEVKFRENNNWNVQIGQIDWPGGTGVGSNNDPNIRAVPGTYSVALNRLTRVYSFATLSNENFTKYNFDFYPNPTTNVWNFKSAGNVINSIIVIDALGKTVINTNPNALETTIDASSLSSGIYFAKVTSDGKAQSVKLIKN